MVRRRSIASPSFGQKNLTDEPGFVPWLCLYFLASYIAKSALRISSALVVPSCGYSEMPMLQDAFQSDPLNFIGLRKDSMIRLATNVAESASVLGSKSKNSSPPTRATFEFPRSWLSSRLLDTLKISSPASRIIPASSDSNCNRFGKPVSESVWATIDKWFTASSSFVWAARSSVISCTVPTSKSSPVDVSITFFDVRRVLVTLSESVITSSYWIGWRLWTLRTTEFEKSLRFPATNFCRTIFRTRFDWKVLST